ncbi:MAG TPA: ABC transporter permease [Solirubrobacteraceae bacterium]|nr:ABC transporter permease [Solirubrobacteraceae bacterium]
MPELIVNNLVRRIGRTLLTALGVGLGVATIVALLSVSDGLTQTAAGFIHLGGSDLGVFQSGVSDPTVSRLQTSLVARLERDPDVAAATPLVLLVGRVREDASAFVFGADPHGFFANRLVFANGGPPSPAGTIAVGDGLARTLKLRPGSSLVVAGRRLTVSGTYHSGIPYEDEGAVLPLARAQSLAGLTGEATTIAVELGPGTSAAAATRSLQRQFQGIEVIADPGEAARAGANGALIHNATLVIVIIAIVLGAISVTNTMAMSVLERQGELALLSTVGWSAPRVAALVIGEGIGVSLLGAAIGLVFGVLGSLLLIKLMGVGAYVSPSITAWGLGRGLLVGISIGVLGGLWPAWRVTRMAPLRGLSRVA